eukprot:TRINITY_DN1635_c0_g2_i1.p2 TRINITY_DN1635_c0_g2~~TRINITY_DN1635_c0_g2_i1.p2  ORF type:complete len:221 (+),score=41.02 TRINITY_DN1635_c0_g2_i1:1137-1799(+)
MKVLVLFRIHALDEKDFKKNTYANAIASGNTISLSNELRAHNILLINCRLLLRRYATTLEEDKATLSKGGLTKRTKLILQYLIYEKSLIQSNITLCEAKIASLSNKIKKKELKKKEAELNVVLSEQKSVDRKQTEEAPQSNVKDVQAPITESDKQTHDAKEEQTHDAEKKQTEHQSSIVTEELKQDNAPSHQKPVIENQTQESKSNHTTEENQHTKQDNH